MNIICHVKYPLFLSNFNQTWISSIYFKNAVNIKFCKNSSSGNRVVLWEHRQTDRQTKLVTAFWNCANELETEYFDRHTTVLDLNYLPTALHQAAKSMKCMHVNWYIVWFCVWICKQCADKPFSTPNNETNWTIEVVYPSREWFGPSVDNCMK